MVIFAKMLKCPECGFPLDLNILGVTSGIGPEVALCRKCKMEFKSGRKEWPFSTKKELLVSIASSLFLVSIGSLISANCFFSGIERWNGNKKPASLPFENQLFQKLFVTSLAVLSIFQIIRVIQSAKRNRKQNPPTTSTFFTPDFVFGVQFKILILILVFSSFGYFK